MNNYALFFAILREHQIPLPESEYRFNPFRRWRADLAWPEQLLLLEVEGGVWTRGRHTRGAGFMKDMEKYNEMAVMGFRLLRVVPSEIKDGTAALIIIRFFENLVNKLKP